MRKRCGTDVSENLVQQKSARAKIIDAAVTLLQQAFSGRV
jgi:hypothetical protein